MIHRQLVKFLIVGGVGTLLNYTIFYVLYSLLNLHYLIASTVGYICGLILGYVLNRNWSFVEHKSHQKTSEFIKYTIVYLSSLIISLGALELFVSLLQLNPLLANVLAIGVSTTTNFIGLKLIVFNGKATHHVSRH